MGPFHFTDFKALPVSRKRPCLGPEIEQRLAFNKFTGLLEVVQHFHLRVDSKREVDRGQEIVWMNWLLLDF